MISNNDILLCLEKLCLANGTPGDEGEIASISMKELNKYIPSQIDNLGNVVGRNKTDGIHFLLDAHMDRIGMVVTAITEDGFIKVGACGGLDTRTLDAAEVIIYGKKPIYGVVSAIPPHLTKSGENKASDITDIVIDIGMDKETAEKYITASDRVIIKTKFNKLLGTRVTCAALDDRSGIMSLLIACDILKERGKIPNLTVTFSCGEEVGGYGAKTSSFKSKADEAIAVDVSFAKAPGVSPEESGILSNGPMVGFAGTLNYQMSKALIEVAQKCEIPYQKEIMSSITGTNADSISISGEGVKMGLISIPLRNMHTQAEIVDIEDIKNTGKLIAEYIIKRMEEC